MKTIITSLLAAVALVSCSPKYGCFSGKDLQKHDLKPFKVLRIKHDKKKDVYYVHAWRYGHRRSFTFACLCGVDVGTTWTDSQIDSLERLQRLSLNESVE